ncbi:2-isopropylmalate synthase [Candidatus Woesearchaeota archaeon]|nr:2-isopropylmalate synthase [Candidatus Woesearchaeota archaeon]
MKIEIMDTTLRDGEQTHGVSFTSEEKFSITRMLLKSVNVDRIEVGNAKVSEGEKQAIVDICNWAKKAKVLDRIEALGFVDGNNSADWILSTGCNTLNLLTKGSKRHCEKQLRKKPDEHFADIKKTIEYAHSKGMTVNVYLEDWSSGMLESKDYVFSLTELLIGLKVKRIMLPDTLGRLNPDKTFELVAEMVKKYPGAHFDFHAHNDYGLATANSVAASKAGAKGIHVTVNCLGERAGNASLDEVAVALKDFNGAELSISEKSLKGMSRLVEIFSGKRISSSKPITGDDVFTQTAGIHADGDKKGNLYTTKLTPDRFKRERIYALGKLSGKASLEMNLNSLNIDLTDDQKKLVLKKIVELGDLKKTVTKEDLPFIISDILKTPLKKNFEITDYEILSSSGKKPIARIHVMLNGKELSSYSEGDGGYDAFMNSLKKLEKDFNFHIPRLVDYNVRIPPGGKTDALVETTITWLGKDIEMKTVGVDSDQVVAAIKATEKMLNQIERNNKK